jgi:segregation and condensation protein A
MVPSAEYTVRLDAFEGPLDLLLFLIRRAEVEITDIPIAQITDQYLRFIGDLNDDGTGGHRLDIERAGEFLVMAATLVEIKSRTLAPVQAVTPEGEIIPEDGEASTKPQKPHLDPRAELIHQLLEYKRFRDAGDRLNKYKHDWESMFPAAKALAGKEETAEAPPQSPEEITGPVDLDDIELIDLVEAFSRIIETMDLSRVGEHHVLMDDTPVEIHAEDIVDRLRRQAAELLAAVGGTYDANNPAPPAELEFAKVFENRNRSEVIGLFLAVLELVKQQRIWVRQEDDDRVGKRIVLRLAEEPVVVVAPAQAADQPADAT